MRWFLVLGLFFLVGCATAPTPISSAPTATALPVAATPPATATVNALPRPAPTLFFADTITTNLIIQQDQLSQTVVLSNTMDFLAVRDDGTQIAIQPHDADITILNLADHTLQPINSRCDSMVWTLDGQSLICARHGNIYTIQDNGMSDTLTTVATGLNTYGEFVWRTQSAQLWFSLDGGTTPKSAPSVVAPQHSCVSAMANNHVGHPTGNGSPIGSATASPCNRLMPANNTA